MKPDVPILLKTIMTGNQRDVTNKDCNFWTVTVSSNPFLHEKNKNLYLYKQDFESYFIVFM